MYKIAEGSSFTFDSHFITSSTSSAVSIGCKGDHHHHDLYSQASSKGITVSFMTASQNNTIYISSAGSDVEILPDSEVEAVTKIMTTGFVSPTVTAVQSPSKMNKSTIKYMVKVIGGYRPGRARALSGLKFSTGSMMSS